MVDLNKLVEKRKTGISPLAAASTRKADGKQKRNQSQDTAGPAWFNMPKPEMTPELEKDLRVIRMRSALDPKRHYRNGPILTSKYFEVGTVIASADEYYSAGRVTRKQQGTGVLDTLMKDEEKRAYFKKKFAASQTKNRAGGKMDYKQKQASIKKPWKR